MTPPEPGFVYLIQCLLPSGEPGPVKIGHRALGSKNRLSGLQVGSPFQLIFLAEMKVPDARGFERLLHRVFSRDRVRGEWFGWSSMLDALAARFRNATEHGQ